MQNNFSLQPKCKAINNNKPIKVMLTTLQSTEVLFTQIDFLFTLQNLFYVNMFNFFINMIPKKIKNNVMSFMVYGTNFEQLK